MNTLTLSDAVWGRRTGADGGGGGGRSGDHWDQENLLVEYDKRRSLGESYWWIMVEGVALGESVSLLSLHRAPALKL